MIANRFIALASSIPTELFNVRLQINERDFVMVKNVLLRLTIFLLPVLILAQEGKMRGIVVDVDTGEPLVGANVTLQGTNMGAATDLEGSYIILAVPPGVYSVRSDFIGYQSEVDANIRVSSNLTTTQDFRLKQTAIEGEAVFIIAERPIVQRNTTNTVRMTTQEDVQNMPIRGMQNILALNAGTVQQDGGLHVRGGRVGEIAYFIDGATATNPLYNSENVSIIQEAIEEIQMQTGGFTAEYGGANSGIVTSTVRTGGPEFRGSLDIRTDDFAKGGDEFLGSTSQGYNNIVATIGGPLPFAPKGRFFVAVQSNYLRNRSRLFLEPFSFSEFYDDGLEGRTVGDTLPDPIAFERNFLPNNDRKNLDLNGTMTYDVSDAIKLRLTGMYSSLRAPNGYNNFYSALLNTFSNTEDISTTKTSLLGLRITHLLSSTTFYNLSLNYSGRNYKNFDPRFGDDWLEYTDRNEWGAAGLDTSDWQGLYRGPVEYSIIRNFRMTPEWQPKNSYSKNSQTSFGGALNVTSQITKNIELKLGGRIDMWTMRNYRVGNIRNYLTFLNGADGSADRTFENDYVRSVELGNQGYVDRYGWDVDGLKEVDSGPNGARTPTISSAYAQSKLEYRDLILNLGLRFESYDLKVPRPASLEDPARDLVNAWIDEDAMIETDAYTYLMPRLNFAFPVTDKTVFYAQYGEYTQLHNLSGIYKGGLRSWVKPMLPESRRITGSAASFMAKPERTSQYELGLRQKITDSFAFTATLFYKDLLDQVRGGQILADGTGEFAEGTMIVGGLVNDDIGTTKGIELTLKLRRTNRLSAQVNYTLSSSRGTGSDSRSTRIAISDVSFAKYPLFISNMDHNQPHRGSVLLDYRFGKGDGGAILQGFGINTVMTFNSGHSFTRVSEPGNLGQATPWNIGVRATQDPRQRFPAEVLNTSLTPWVFNVDMAVDKRLYFDRYNVRFFVNVLNLLNAKNILNVYQTTGTDDDDGWLKSPLAGNFIATPGYLDFYQAVNLDNRWHYLGATGHDLWSQPRSIRFGMTLEFK